jgi:hypothetical protein
VTYGPQWYQRGHWSDRLAAIDKDIAAMAGAASAPRAAPAPPPDRIATIVKAVQDRPVRPRRTAYHEPPHAFVRGRPLTLALQLHANADAATLTLHYRHTNQAETWQSLPMRTGRTLHHATIPGAYTDTAYPLTYYFEVTEPSGGAWLHPGLGAELTQQPYFVVRAAR